MIVFIYILDDNDDDNIAKKSLQFSSRVTYLPTYSIFYTLNQLLAAVVF